MILLYNLIGFALRACLLLAKTRSVTAEGAYARFAQEAVKLSGLCKRPHIPTPEALALYNKTLADLGCAVAGRNAWETEYHNRQLWAERLAQTLIRWKAWLGKGSGWLCGAKDSILALTLLWSCGINPNAIVEPVKAALNSPVESLERIFGIASKSRPAEPTCEKYKKLEHGFDGIPENAVFHACCDAHTRVVDNEAYWSTEDRCGMFNRCEAPPELTARIAHLPPVGSVLRR